MFRSAVRALKVQHIGPDTGHGGVVDIKLKINRLSGLTAPTSQTTRHVAREPRKKQSCFIAAFLLLGWLRNARYMRPSEHWSGAQSSPLVIPSFNVAD
jgi:hypothetical protein